MHFKHLSTTFFAMAIGTATLTAQAGNNNWGGGPNWGGMNMPSFNTNSSPYNYNRPPPGYYGAPNYRSAPNYRGAPNYQQQNRPAPMPAPNMNRPPNRNMAPPPAGMNRGYPPPPQGPYNAGPRGPARDNGASAYNMPGYNRYNNNRNRNSRFFGRSGPSTWMSPSKDNWENSWDDMINSPSRMGEMPGGWTAPEVSVPNPIDMGDQMQDNLQDLPDQMKDGNIGNNISD
jgi:hypothetical protein